MATEKAPVALTGGAGFEFHDCVAARFMIDLLHGRCSLGAEWGAIVKVAWEARESGWLADDLVLSCQRGNWARLRVLISESPLPAGRWRELAKNPRWHGAMRLFGVWCANRDRLAGHQP